MKFGFSDLCLGGGTADINSSGNNRPMNRPFTSALTDFAVTVGVLLSKWRATKRGIAILTDRDQFVDLISSLPDASVSKLLADYELLAALDGFDRFRWKRDRCREELANRRTQRVA